MSRHRARPGRRTEVGEQRRLARSGRLPARAVAEDRGRVEGGWVRRGRRPVVTGDGLGLLRSRGSLVGAVRAARRHPGRRDLVIGPELWRLGDTGHDRGSLPALGPLDRGEQGAARGAGEPPLYDHCEHSGQTMTFVATQASGLRVPDRLAGSATAWQSPTGVPSPRPGHPRPCQSSPFERTRTSTRCCGRPPGRRSRGASPPTPRPAAGGP